MAERIRTLWAVTDGAYSDYRVIAVFEREQGWWRKDGFRAAMKVAYQAGYEQWRREHPLPICDGGEVVMVTDLKAWMRGEVADG